MRRREFIGLVGSAAAAWPLAARATTRDTSSRNSLQRTNRWFAGRDGCVPNGLGRDWLHRTVGTYISSIEPPDHMDRLPGLANELVHRRVAVIFSASTAATVLAAKAATVEIPIVFSMGADPVGIGAVASLARPGGNITGITVLAGELIGKRFEFLHEIVPTAATVAYLVNTANPAFSEAALKIRTDNARATGLRLLIVNANTPNDIDRGFASLFAENAGALLVGPDTFFQTQREQIVALAARYRIPASYPWPEDVRSGGLFSYGADFLDVFRRAGIYVGRILNGEKAADLPVQQPTKFRLAVNPTAKVLDLAVPPHILARADEVNE